MLKYWLKQNYKLAKAHLDWARGAPKLHRKFFLNHGYQLNIENPQTFAEKIQWRKLRDNNPIFPILSNKYLVRKYIASRLGERRAQELLVPLLQYTKDPGRIDFAALPNQFVLKATHGSGMNLIVEDATQLDQSATRVKMRKWLIKHYGIEDHEWNYMKTPRGILVEELIAKPNQLIDLKIFYFSGRAEILFMSANKDGRKFSNFFDADAKPIDVRTPDAPKNPNAELPAKFDEMIVCGEILSKGMDFLRVDFLYTPDRFHVGELTLHPNSGLLALDPPSYHKMVGNFWKLPARGHA